MLYVCVLYVCVVYESVVFVCVVYAYFLYVCCMYVVCMCGVCMWVGSGSMRMYACVCAYIYDARTGECALLAYILPEPYIVCVCDRMYIMLTPCHALA